MTAGGKIVVRGKSAAVAVTVSPGYDGVNGLSEVIIRSASLSHLLECVLPIRGDLPDREDGNATFPS